MDNLNILTLEIIDISSNNLLSTQNCHSDYIIDLIFSWGYDQYKFVLKDCNGNFLPNFL